MDGDDWNKYERVKYEKKNRKTNYDNTIKILTHKLGLKAKVSLDHPNHEHILLSIREALGEHSKRETKRRNSKNKKFGNHYGDSL